MIQEIDRALRGLLDRDASLPDDVAVVFDAPTKDWAAKRSVPTLDLYLYDIRRDLERDTAGMAEIRDDDGRLLARRPQPRYFKLSYLVTAWTQRPEDEHHLLSETLVALLRHDRIPPDLLDGPLAELGLIAPVTIALPPPEDRSISDVWTALGGELKPSLDLVVSTPLEAGQPEQAGPPTERAVLRAANRADGSAPPDVRPSDWPPDARVPA